MSQLETDIGRFSLYAQQFNTYPSTTIIGALILRLAESGVSTSSNGTIAGGATADKQDEIIALLSQLVTLMTQICGKQAEDIELSETTANILGTNNLDEAIALLANSGQGVAGQTEEKTLAVLPADTWTNFPTASFIYSDWRIYHNQIEVTDNFLIRNENGIYQIRSSIAKNNLVFVFSS